MATYKAVMRPALTYGRMLHPQPALIMQNAALRTAPGCTQDQTYNICMMKHSHFPYTSTYSSTSHSTNRKHNIHHIHYTNILKHSKAKHLYLKQRPLHNKPSHSSHTVTTADIETNVRHIHISIVSRHLATRGNNKIILSTPPPHISSSEEILLRLTRRTLAKL